MARDPIDNEISIDAEITPTGLSAKAKSRLLSGVDRLFGNLTEYPNIAMERRHNLERAKMEADQQLIGAATKLAIERMGEDREFAERTLRNLLGRSLSRQNNKDEVAKHAIEDLRRDSSSNEGDATLNPDFLNRFERHAEDASSDEAREKWGRVLAAEVRRPGTISARAMRLIDELDGPTAHLFEQLCANRLGQVVPTCLSGILPFNVRKSLVEAGLLVEPGTQGHVSEGSLVDVTDGVQLVLFQVEGFDFRVRGPWSFAAVLQIEASPLVAQQIIPAIPIYLMTSDGAAISQILPNQQKKAFKTYIDKLRAFLPEGREIEIVSVRDQAA